MRRILLMLLFAAICFGKSGAQSMLKVRLADNRPINVWLDGRYFNKTGTSVTVGDLPAGRHTLKIYSKSQRRRGRGYEEVVYQGKINTYRGMITLFYLDPFSGQNDVKEQYINSYVQDHPSTGIGEWRGETGDNKHNSSNDNEDQDGESTQQSGPVASPVIPDRPVSFTQAKADKLKSKVASKKVDIEKMNQLKAGLKGETYNTGQVSDMMNWFSFESSKVEFAEWAYPKTVDKEMYHDLVNKLNFKKYQDELEQFINAQPPVE